MILGIGVDIVEVKRMKAAIDKWGDNFLDKVFTSREVSYSNARRFSSQHYAGRFAAKEAVIKAFGEARKYPIKMHEVEVVNDAEGKPIVKFYGSALKLKKLKKVSNVMISISHSKEYAIANAFLMKKG